MALLEQLRAIPLPGMRLLARRPGRAAAHAAFPDPAVADLAIAVRARRRNRVRALVRTGIDVDARGNRGVTMLHWSLLTKSRACMSELLAAGADPAQPDDSGFTVMHLAAMANDPRYLTALLDGGADPDTRHALTGATPLDSSLLAREDTQFRALLAAHADPNAADRMGNTPLHQAAKVHSVDKVLALLAAGADPNAVNSQRATFQTYLFLIGPAHTSPSDHRDLVRTWLMAHDVPVVG